MDRLAGLREADHFGPAIKAKIDTVNFSRQILGLLADRQLLPRLDDELFEDFKTSFPELNLSSALEKLNEDEMKSAKGKSRWREYIMKVSGRDCHQGQLVLTLGPRLVREEGAGLQLWNDPAGRCETAVRAG